MAASELPFLLVGTESATSVLEDSPALNRWLKRNKIRLVPVSWSGKPREFPPDRHCLVYCSSSITGSTLDIIRRCTAGSHVLFYDDKLIDGQGRHGVPDLLDAVQWLINLRERLYPNPS